MHKKSGKKMKIYFDQINIVFVALFEKNIFFPMSQKPYWNRKMHKYIFLFPTFAMSFFLQFARFSSEKFDFSSALSRKSGYNKMGHGARQEWVNVY